ncbi:hypothetical protein [Marinobacterium litorale]|uniref:hypothetical protein n=1 Tax=Marinobacterium litorale TaxID=404770 RepID=UPI00048977A9|nr:hypothetical protein [Marinobacterium litorale]
MSLQDRDYMKQDRRDRQANVDRWNLGDWRKEAHPTQLARARKNRKHDKSTEELYTIIRSQRTQLIISVGLNALLLYHLMF